MAVRGGCSMAGGGSDFLCFMVILGDVRRCVYRKNPRTPSTCHVLNQEEERKGSSRTSCNQLVLLAVEGDQNNHKSRR